jgi:hypothetical protein
LDGGILQLRSNDCDFSSAVRVGDEVIILLLGALDFLGGMPLLRHLPIKISEFLHKNHGDKFLFLQLPGSQTRLRLQQIDQLFEKIETFDKDDTMIVLHGGVMIGHKEYQGYQRVYACSFPHKKFRA